MDEQHKVEVDQLSPRIMRIRWSGRLSQPDYDAIVAYAEAMLAELEAGASLRLLTLVGAKPRIDAAVRKSFVEMGRQGTFGRSAIVDAPRPIRVLMALVENAVRVLSENRTTTRFFDSEAEALAWLEEP